MDKKVFLDVVPPFDLVSEFRRSRGSSVGGELNGEGGNKKDNLLKQQVVLSCRGGRIRTCDLLLPKQAR